MNKYNYTIFRPGGNDTALVNTLVNDKNLRKKINDLIMKENPNVEQVGFIQKRNNKYFLTKAGGEFCGNATRSAAYFFLKGKTGTIKINVSGVKKPISAGIDKSGNIWANMPIFSDPAKISKIRAYTTIKMQGITHVISKRKNPFKRRESAKRVARRILKKLNLIKTVPASGVMFIRKLKGKIYMEPVVWVRDISTFFYETACGSGTTAVGLYESFRKKTSVSLPVIQPSGMTIRVEVKFKRRFVKAKISGIVEELGKDVICIT